MLSDLSSDQKGGDLIYDSSSWALGCIQILPSLPVQRLFSLAYPFLLMIQGCIRFHLPSRQDTGTVWRTLLG